MKSLKSYEVLILNSIGVMAALSVLGGAEISVDEQTAIAAGAVAALNIIGRFVTVRQLRNKQ